MMRIAGKRSRQTDEFLEPEMSRVLRSNSQRIPSRTSVHPDFSARTGLFEHRERGANSLEELAP
jgi:hypothetical protein